MKRFQLLLFASLCFSILIGCTDKKQETNNYSNVPEWTKNAIWYQVFVERFRNGDPSNDPIKESLIGAYPEHNPKNWKTTPWTRQWFQKDNWFYEMPDTNWDYGIQARRLGGDLQGVLDKLDYLSELGINAIYFNPLNDSPSLHKYDAASYHHIDRHFGPDPAGDTKLMKSENPIDPQTWQWTTADKLFLEVINECHKRNIRVIMDYSWNHTGINFWAFRDVWEKGEKSDYADWYYVNSYNDPNTAADEFEWKGWFGHKWLPEFKEIIEGEEDHESIRLIEGNLYSQALKQHIFNVSERWLDPNNDGNTEDGVDGYRLDVAAEIPMGFWREYRAYIKNINPEAYLVGEIWWEAWPDKLLDPAPFLGEAFDAVMNYRWYRAARGLFAQTEDKRTPTEFAAEIKSLQTGIEHQYSESMMNVAASHDTPRLSTSLYNKNKYKNGAKMKDNKAYKSNKPDAATKRIQKMLLIQQYSYIGAPHIWMGDEVGMWGEDDPNNRKPHVWSDLEYEAETIDALGNPLPEPDVVKVDEDLFNFYQQLNKIRKENLVLTYGELEFILADDENLTLAYTRTMDDVQALAVFNISKSEKDITLPNLKKKTYRSLLEAGVKFETGNGKLLISLEPRSAMLLIGE